MNDIKTAIILLHKVIKTCRCKSSIPTVTWKELEIDINKFLNDSEVDISKDEVEKIVKVYRKQQGVKQYISDNSFLKQHNSILTTENLKVKSQNIKYAQAIKVFRSVLNQLEKQSTIK